MKIVVRADGNSSIGAGHIMRCLALARVADADGADVHFASSELSDELRHHLAREGFEATIIDDRRGSQGDRRALVEICRRTDADWIVIDGYCFDAAFQQGLRAELEELDTSILFIDDLGGDATCADLVLNQNLHATPELYEGVDPSRLMLGLRFLLLRPEFDQWSDWSRQVSKFERLLVISGTDPECVMVDMVASLAEVLDRSINVDVVGVDGEAVRKRAPDASRFNFHGRLERVSEAMAEADVAVATSGSLSWELLYMQLPAVLVPVADNQRPLAAELARLPGYFVVDEPADSGCVAHHLRMLENVELRGITAQTSRHIVDGRGARRVYRMLKQKLLRLRPCQADDCRQLWLWANEPIVRELAFEQDEIAWSDHQRWFAQKMASEDTQIFVGEHRDGRALGQVRFDGVESLEPVISISVDREFRSGGFGWLLMRSALNAAPADIRLFHAYVKAENTPSLNLFRSLGFKCLGEEDLDGNRAVHFVFDKSH